MSIFDRFKKQKRDGDIISGSALLSTADFNDFLCNGYTSLDQNAEVLTACRKIADVISSMTIYLMANTEHGDVRITNELSRKIDILPNTDMTRKTYMDFIVMTMLLYGKGNAVVYPHTQNGYITDLEPIAASRVTFMPNGRHYDVVIDGKHHDPANLLHFVHNPDRYYPWKGKGLTCALQDIAENLGQAAATEKGFMQSKWKPSLIIKVDSLTDEFASPEGRQRLLDSYMSNANAGEPWLIPAEQFDVKEVRPLSLSDLAISDMVTLDKRTVASILGVPPFVVGVGEYNADEWNAFINNTIRPIARGIEQEMTRKLLISPKMYWKFNIASLYSYDLRTAADVYSNLYVKGIVTGNEVRDKISMTPMDGLDELVILENYIPADRIGDQKKLESDNG